MASHWIRDRFAVIHAIRRVRVTDMDWVINHRKIGDVTVQQLIVPKNGLIFYGPLGQPPPPKDVSPVYWENYGWVPLGDFLHIAKDWIKREAVDPG